MAKILIADDSLSELQIFQAACSRPAIRSLSVMDGEAAEAKVKSEKIDLDHPGCHHAQKKRFPGCRDIKSNEQYKNIPVIMVTSKDQESDKFWGMKQGADEYLTKPFKPEDLLKVVKKYI